MNPRLQIWNRIWQRVGEVKKSCLVAAVLCGLLAVPLWLNIVSTPPRIMVLHSYATDYLWTNLLNQSLQDRYKQSGARVKIRYFYMDTHNPNYARNADLIAQRFLETVEQFGPQVIIAMDDAAQLIISQHYLNHPRVAVVFAGVNHSAAKYGYSGSNNVTGVLEHRPLAAIKEVLIQLHRLDQPYAQTQPAPKVLFLTENSTSGRNHAALLAQQNWRGIDYRGAKRVDSYAKWQQFIRAQSAHYDYLLVATYRQLRDAHGANVDPSEVAAWTQLHSRSRGILGMSVLNAQDGILLSVGVSPYEQGATALNMAFRILRGTDPKTIPVHTPKSYLLALSENAFFNPEVAHPYKTALQQKRAAQ